MVAAQVLETCDLCRVGSNPTWGTLNFLNKFIWQKLNFYYIRYNYKTMRTTMVHTSSFKQQEICSWYRRGRNCGSENMVN